MAQDSLCELVRENLVHFCLWGHVRTYEIRVGDDGTAPFKVVKGRPPNKLMNTDEDNQSEWVVPCVSNKQQKLSIETLTSWFEGIQRLDEDGTRPKRITVGLVNDDGTIVYYFVHDGLVKPRQN